MQQFLTAFVTYMQASGTGFQSFMGSYTNNAGATQRGPFLDIAPEGTTTPFCVYNILNSPSDQGFSATYVEKPIIRLNLYDTDTDNLATNLTLLQAKLDALTGLTLGGGETCRVPLRRSHARIIMDPNDEKGRRVYHAIVDYEFRIQRTKGIYITISSVTNHPTLDAVVIVVFSAAVTAANFPTTFLQIDFGSGYLASDTVTQSTSTTLLVSANAWPRSTAGFPWRMQASASTVVVPESGTVAA